MKKGFIWILGIVIIVFLTLNIFIFKEDYAENKIEVEQELVTLIQKKRQTNDRVIVDFKQVAPFDWDKVYIFTPYTPSD